VGVPNVSRETIRSASARMEGEGNAGLRAQAEQERQGAGEQHGSEHSPNPSCGIRSPWLLWGATGPDDPPVLRGAEPGACECARLQDDLPVPRPLRCAND